jgi:hypothetical protein
MAPIRRRSAEHPPNSSQPSSTSQPSSRKRPAEDEVTKKQEVHMIHLLILEVHLHWILFRIEHKSRLV